MWWHGLVKCDICGARQVSVVHVIEGAEPFGVECCRCSNMSCYRVEDQPDTWDDLQDPDAEDLTLPPTHGE